MAASTERSAIRYGRLVRLGAGLLAAIGGAFLAYESLPAFFVLVAAIMFLLALAALFQSLRTALGDPTADVGLRATLPERAALIDEKNALLRAIKDIAYEHAVGKLSDADFERLDRAYRHRAKEVLRKLDEDLAPYLERAEKIVEARLEGSSGGKGKKRKKLGARRDCPSCGTSNAGDAVHCKECGARIEPRACPACGTENDADAKFCKKCATPLAESARRAGELARGGTEATRSADAGAGLPGNAGESTRAGGEGASAAGREGEGGDDARSPEDPGPERAEGERASARAEEEVVQEGRDDDGRGAERAEPAEAEPARGEGS